MRKRTKPNRKRLTKAVVTAAKPRPDGRDLLVWDTELKGFGLRGPVDSRLTTAD